VTRLSALRSYRILDTPPEPDFDDIVLLASQVCGAPVAAISLVDDRRQWFKAEVGLGTREIPIEASLCAAAALRPGLTLIPDTTKDPRFAAHPLVTDEPFLRFYAGAPLETADGLLLGTLCVLDHAPRDLSPEQAAALKALARQVMGQLELRRAIVERDEALEASRRAEARQGLLVRELHHRTRNHLATLQALLGATARSSRSIEEFYRSFSARIVSLGRTQALLTEDYWQTAPLRDMLRQELQPHVLPERERFALDGPDVSLSADLAVPLSMALHELATNARRHGSLSVPAGRVEVTWSLHHEDGKRLLALEWRERDGPPVEVPRREGVGTKLRRVLELQGNAEVEVDFAPDGLRFRMRAPLIEERLVPAY
jgi:two-component sensor histidine kinase